MPVWSYSDYELCVLLSTRSVKNWRSYGQEYLQEFDLENMVNLKYICLLWNTNDKDYCVPISAKSVKKMKFDLEKGYGKNIYVNNGWHKKGWRLFYPHNINCLTRSSAFLVCSSSKFKKNAISSPVFFVNAATSCRRLWCCRFWKMIMSSTSRRNIFRTSSVCVGCIKIQWKIRVFVLYLIYTKYEFRTQLQIM